MRKDDKRWKDALDDMEFADEHYLEGEHEPEIVLERMVALLLTRLASIEDAIRENTKVRR